MAKPQAPEKPKYKECPDCGNSLPVDEGYVTWCDNCGWNVYPIQTDKPRNLYEKLYKSLGEQQAKKLFKQFTNETQLSSPNSMSRFLAYGISIIVHAITLGMFLLGIYYLLKGSPLFINIPLGILLLGISWILRPRFPKLTSKDKLLPREEYPGLYGFVDMISDEMKAPHLHGIVVDEVFSASVRQIGWQQKPVLVIGLPLWDVLDDQEIIFLVGHEIAHLVNGDPARSVITRTAIDSLSESHFLLHPGKIFDFGRGIAAIFIAPFNLIMFLLAQIPWVLTYLLSHILWLDSQRAEYLADRLSAKLGGSRAAISTLRKLHYGQTYITSVRESALNTDKDFFEIFSHRVSIMPEREKERLRRVQEMEGTRLNITHPPTPFRMRLLEEHRFESPQFKLNPSKFDVIEEELAHLKSNIRNRLRDGYKASLYYR